MTIYYDYTAGRGKYDAEYEEAKNNQKPKVIQNFIPRQNVNTQANQFRYKAKAVETNYDANNNFHYSYEQSAESQNKRYAYNDQRDAQTPRKNFNKTQNNYKKQYNTYRYKKGNNRKQTEIKLGSRYQRNDILD